MSTIKLGQKISVGTFSEVRSTQLDGRPVFVKYFSDKPFALPEQTRLKTLAEVTPDLVISYDEKVETVCLLDFNRQSNPSLHSPKAVIEATRDAIAKLRDTVDRETLVGTGLMLFETLTGCPYDYKRQSGQPVLGPVMTTVIDNMVTRQIAPDHAFVIFDALVATDSSSRATAEIVPDPEPDPDDPKRLGALRAIFLQHAERLVRGATVEKPANDVAKLWLASAERLLSELIASSPPDVAAVLAAERQQLATGLEPALDDELYVHEQGQLLAHAFIAHWTSTLAELLTSQQPMLLLDDHLWPHLEEPHRSEYTRLLEQFGIDESAAAWAWKELGRSIDRAAIVLPNRLRLLNLGTTFAAVRINAGG